MERLEQGLLAQARRAAVVQLAGDGVHHLDAVVAHAPVDAVAGGAAGLPTLGAADAAEVRPTDVVGGAQAVHAVGAGVDRARQVVAVVQAADDDAVDVDRLDEVA